MNTLQKDPIHLERTSCEALPATATTVITQLAAFDVVDLPEEITPFLAAAGAEIALVAGIQWRFSADDVIVVLLRLISRGTLAKPDATGPHTQRLFEQLEQLNQLHQPKAGKDQ